MRLRSWMFTAALVTASVVALPTGAYAATETPAAAAATAPGAASTTVTASSGTATKVSIGVSPSRVEVGTAGRVSGRLYRAVNGDGLPSRFVSLYARQMNETSYRKIAQTATKAGGAYSFSVKPSWSTAYQVRFAGGANRAESNSSYRIIRATGWYWVSSDIGWTYSDDFDGRPPNTYPGRTVTVAGVAYAHSFPQPLAAVDQTWRSDGRGHCDRVDLYIGAPAGKTPSDYDVRVGSVHRQGTVQAGDAPIRIVEPAGLIITGDRDSPNAYLLAARMHCTW